MTFHTNIFTLSKTTCQAASNIKCQQLLEKCQMNFERSLKILEGKSEKISGDFLHYRPRSLVTYRPIVLLIDDQHSWVIGKHFSQCIKQTADKFPTEQYDT